jgi:hypothetical protein
MMAKASQFGDIAGVLRPSIFHRGAGSRSMLSASDS